MRNLLQETIITLEVCGHTFDEIQWIGNENFKIPLNSFKKLADVYYDEGFGGAEVLTDLKIIGMDWWLERHEYDGSEWWEFKQLPKEPKTIIETPTLIRKHLEGYNINKYDYDSLDELRELVKNAAK